MVILSSDWSGSKPLPPLALKSAGLEIGKLKGLDITETGLYYGYYRDGQNYVFVLHLDNGSWVLERGARIYLAAGFNGWGDAIGQPEWELLCGNQNAASSVYSIRVPNERIPTADYFRFKFVTDRGEWLDVPETVLNAVQSPDGIVDFEFNAVCLYQVFD